MEYAWRKRYRLRCIGSADTRGRREREREREREGEGQRDGEKGGEPRELFSEVVPGDIEKWHFPPGGVHPAGSSYEYTNVYQRNVDRIARARI